MKHIIIERLGVNILNGVVASSPAEMQLVLNTFTLPPLWSIVTQGTKLVLIGDGGTELITPEYQAVLDYATTQGYTLPSPENQSAQNVLVAELIDEGIWNDLDVFYNFFTDGDKNFALINWKAPGTFSCVDGASPTTFTPLSGIVKANIGTQYLATGFIPANHAVNYKLVDAGMFMDAIDNGHANAELVILTAFADALSVNRSQMTFIGSSTAGGQRWRPSFNANVTSNGVNQVGPPLVRVDGFFHAHWRTIGLNSCFLNGEQAFTNIATAPPVALTSLADLVLFESNIAGDYTGLVRTGARCFGLGASLAGKELALYNTWTAYKNSI